MKSLPVWASVVVIAVVFALRVFGFMAVLPLLMKQGRMYLESTPALLGAAIGVYGLAQASMQIILGAWSDRIGRHRVIYLGLGVLVFGSVVAAMSHSVWGLILGRALQGLGAVGSTLMALLADVVSEKHRAKAMACVGIGIGGAFWLSVIVGPVLYDVLGFSGLFSLMAVLGCVAVGLIYLVPKQPLPVSQLSLKMLWMQVLREPVLLRLDFGVAALHALFTLVFAFLPQILVLIGYLKAPSGAWSFYLGALGVALCVSFPLIAWAERYGRLHTAVRLGVLLLGGSCLLWGTMGLNWWPVFIGLGAFLSGFNTLEALLMALVSRCAQKKQEGLHLACIVPLSF